MLLHPTAMHKTSLLKTALREIVFITLGIALAFLLGYLFSDRRPVPANMPANPLLAVFGSIVLCLTRAALVGDRRFHVSNTRWIAYQFIFAFALVLLLIFEMGMGLFVGAIGVPAWAWLVLFAIALAYVTTICVSELIVPAHDRDTFEIWS